MSITDTKINRARTSMSFSVISYINAQFMFEKSITVMKDLLDSPMNGISHKYSHIFI